MPARLKAIHQRLPTLAADANKSSLMDTHAAGLSTARRFGAPKEFPPSPRDRRSADGRHAVMASLSATTARSSTIALLLVLGS